ncbi:MAG TPA: IPT/TIG domain-containing protein [Ktedonobacteraceae bacterium]
MNPEEYLDRWIERREHGEVQIPVANNEVAASLAAAEVLARLQKIDIPTEFAGHLELYVRAHARGLAQQNGRTVPIARLRSPAGSLHFQMRRTWIAILGIAAVLMLACAGVLTVSARSLPGDALYGLKQAENQLTLTFASDPRNRANFQIDQLQNALVDLSTVVNDKRDDDAARLALNIVAAKTSDSRGAVAALPAGPDREAAQQHLNGVLAEEEQILRHLLDHANWPMRVAFTHQLGALGDPVPTVTRVVVSIQTNGTHLITLTGTHFAPHVELIIDGRPVGMVSQSTSEQLVAVINNAAWPAGEHAFGVRNPDGTAAQMALDGDDHELNQQDSDHSRTGTPVPDGDFDD